MKETKKVFIRVFDVNPETKEFTYVFSQINDVNLIGKLLATAIKVIAKMNPEEFSLEKFKADLLDSHLKSRDELDNMVTDYETTPIEYSKDDLDELTKIAEDDNFDNDFFTILIVFNDEEPPKDDSLSQVTIDLICRSTVLPILHEIIDSIIVSYVKVKDWSYIDILKAFYNELDNNKDYSVIEEEV